MVLIQIGADHYSVPPKFAQAFGEILNQFASPQRKRNKDDSQHTLTSELARAFASELILSTNDNIYKILLVELIYCHSQGNYTTFHLRGGDRILISKSMKAVQAMILSGDFVRCHQSYLVNTNYVERYNRNGVLVLSSGEKIPVSASRKALTFEVVFGIKD